MKLVVGLGNPGEKYKNNRHNIGFVVVERLKASIPPKRDVGSDDDWIESARFFGDYCAFENVLLLRPSTFMNESGKAVSAIVRFYKLKNDDIYIIHDDLDIPLGKYKIQHGKGPQVHNGLLSVEKELGSDQFWNVRIGIENREIKGNKGVPGVVYSLQDFDKTEQLIIERVSKSVVEDLLTRLS